MVGGFWQKRYPDEIDLRKDDVISVLEKDVPVWWCSVVRGDIGIMWYGAMWHGIFNVVVVHV